MTFATIPPVNATRDINPNCPPGFSSLPYLSDLWHPTTGEHMQFEPYLYESTAPLERSSSAYSVPARIPRLTRWARRGIRCRPGN